MRPNPFEIWLARLPLGHSTDTRPWVVVLPPQNDPEHPGKFSVTLAPVSSALDLVGDDDFPITPEDPEFLHTGLRKESFVIGDRAVRVRGDRLLRKLGELRGELGERFERWAQS